jgi:hypothetical protein
MEPQIPLHFSAAPEPPKVRGKKRLTSGIVLTVLGVLALVAGVIGVGRSTIVDTLSADIYSAPGSFEVELEQGTHTVFASSRPTAPDVTITGPGAQATLRRASGSETLTRNQLELRSVHSFEVTTPGTYQVTMSGGYDGNVAVTRSIVDGVTSALAWVAAVLLGSLLAVIGAVLIIVGAVTRSRSSREIEQTTVPPGFPPPAPPVGPLH